MRPVSPGRDMHITKAYLPFVDCLGLCTQALLICGRVQKVGASSHLVVSTAEGIENTGIEVSLVGLEHAGWLVIFERLRRANVA
jgi:hypothetical protein